MKLARPCALLLTLLASVAGVSSPLIAAEIREVRIAATDAGTRVVLELSGPVKHKAFQLEDPGRVVLDLAKSSLKTKLPQGEAAITKVRSGKLPNNGTRLVFEIKGPVTIQTSRLAATADDAERLVLDISAPGSSPSPGVRRLRLPRLPRQRRPWPSVRRTHPRKAVATSSWPSTRGTAAWIPARPGVVARARKTWYWPSPRRWRRASMKSRA